MNSSGSERHMGENDIIVSKTNPKGHLTYGNDIFCSIADFSVKEIMGQPHSILRNEQMPRCVFKLLWDTIQKGEELFAYVVNKTKHGDYYWVFAHVTPSFDVNGNIMGYHSNRRKPRREALQIIEQLYSTLLQEENRHSNRKDGMQAGHDLLMNTLKEKGKSYDEFILSI